LKNLAGKNVKLSEVLDDYNLVMIDFFFVGCKPCAEYMEYFDGWEKKFSDRGFKILAINTDPQQDTGNVKPYIDGRGYKFTVLLDPTGDVKKRLQVKAEPTTIMINKQREVVYRHQGYKKGVEADVEAAIDANLPPED
jgi:cytochrome c biogenesis protein CcmG, thiol:disulfide interchange protein DsbE